VCAAKKGGCLSNDVFTFKKGKNSIVFIYWQGRLVKTVKGRKAESFLDRINGLSTENTQLESARITGNFKRGNERK